MINNLVSPYISHRTDDTRSTLIFIVLILLGLTIGALTAVEFFTPILLLLLLIGIVYISLNWHKDMVFLSFFVWINIEDIFRILLNNNLLFYFVKDIYYAAMLAGFSYAYFIKQQETKLENPIKLPLVLFLIFALLQSFNPNLKHPALPFIGFKAQFFYIPMFFLSYKYFSTEKRINNFIILTLTMIALESVLSVIQLIKGPQWWFSLVGKPETLDIFVGRAGALADEVIFRPSSIFANAGRFIQYLSVGSTILVGTSVVFRKMKLKMLFGSYLILTIMAMFVTSGRTTMYLFIITVLAYLFFMRDARKLLKIAAVLSLGLLSITTIFSLDADMRDYFIIISHLFTVPLSSMFNTDTSIWISETAVSRGILYWSEIIRALIESGLSGHGTGTSSLGMYFVGIEFIEGAEPGYAALIWEYGILGPILWLLMMGTLWLKALSCFRDTRNSKFRELAFSIFLLITYSFVYQYVGFQILQNYIVQIYFWTFAGMLFAMRRLIIEENKCEFS
ncbi:MAG: hypothetical protein HY758_08535 [Nitrospirae bacterium]|nr:hypothetical protein [Nitrospirota bacterium]